ncbi:MAG: ribokinase [Victivallaceae bacterium]
MLDVLNFGSLNIDRVYRLDHLVRPGETILSRSYSVFAGGKGLNQSIALARAGLRVGHAGKVGPDGGLLLQTLEADGVDVSGVLRNGSVSGHACIEVDDRGENAIILFAGANGELTREEITAVLDRVGQETILLLQNELNDTAFILRQAAKRRLKVAINPAPCPPEVRDYPLNDVRYLFVNEVEAATLSGETNPEAALAILVSRLPRAEIVITLGGKGALAGSAGSRHFTPVVPAKVIDTTCAGDTFNGYYLAGRLRGLTIPAALARAARAAAVTVSRPGAAPSIPVYSEIE